MPIFKRIMQKTFYCFLLAVMVLSLCSCAMNTDPKTEQAFLLDTIVTVTYYSRRDLAAVQEAIDLCRDAELVFSRTDSRSELYQLNLERTAEVSDSLLEVLSAALSVCKASSGRFDISMGGVSSLYDFDGSRPHCPDPEELSAAIQQVDYRKIQIDGNKVTLGNSEMILDLGAIAKGYIADQMKEYLLEHGVKHAIISLGGNVLCIGGKPDGSEYTVGIKYPEKNTTTMLTAIHTMENSVVTSGVYERCFEEDGTIYHHLLDSESGYPIHNGLLSVSVIGPCSLQCDALSTACFAMGLEDGLAYINSLDGYEAVFITQDHELHKSFGFTALERN